MDIWNIDSLILFLLFTIPGFISTKLYGLFYPERTKSFQSYLFEVVCFSSFNYALFSWLIWLNYNYTTYDNHHWAFLLSIIVIGLIGPIMWPIIFMLILKIPFVKNKIMHPILKPWDFVFHQKTPFFIIVHLVDGRRIGGLYYTKSFASSYPAEEQIYLEKVYSLDENGAFSSEPVSRSKGIIILNKDISSVEMFSIGDEKNE